jgi:hypothetical protein
VSGRTSIGQVPEDEAAVDLYGAPGENAGLRVLEVEDVRWSRSRGIPDRSACCTVAGVKDPLVEIDALITELVANTGALVHATHENVQLLAQLVAERRAADGSAPAAGGSSHLAPDVLAIAVLHAQAAGLTLEDYLRDAVLAYSGRIADGDGDGDGAAGALDARLREARAAALRIRDESRALAAQSTQAKARTAELGREAEAARAARSADGDGDGDGDGDAPPAGAKRPGAA